MIESLPYGVLDGPNARSYVVDHNLYILNVELHPLNAHLNCLRLNPKYSNLLSYVDQTANLLKERIRSVLR